MNDLKRMVGEPDRKRYIGGSDVAAILGLDPYGKTPYTTYLAKIGEAPAEMDADKKLFLIRRKRWEGPVIEMLREDFGGTIVRVSTDADPNRYIDAEHDFMAAEIDFEWAEGDGPIGNGEIKTVSPRAFGERFGWGEEGTDEVPIHYAAQVMHGLGVTGRQACIVAAMIGLDSMIFYRIERDDDLISDIRAKLKRFWFEHVIPRRPPEPIVIEDQIKMMLRQKGHPVQLTDEQLSMLKRIREIGHSIRRLEEEDEEIKFQLLDTIRRAWDIPADQELPEDSALLMRGDVVVSKYARTRGAGLDQKRLKLDKPDLVREYTREYYYRKLTFLKSLGEVQ